MTIARELTRITVVGAMAAGTFFFVHVSLTAKEEMRAEAGEAPSAKVLLSEAPESNRPLSPLTAVSLPKVRVSALAAPHQRVKAAKLKVPANQPVQVAQRPTPKTAAYAQISSSYAPEPEPPKAAGIFETLFARN